jgi:hypothetical protein
MLDVAIGELTIERILIKQLLGSRHNYVLDDEQLIKRILSQLQALNLISSTWNNDAKIPCWGLTEKGKKVRDDMILIKK